ncbi:hypothetical protein DL89DRAFT_269214 [Linderina pennispora]|uniref:Efficient mitochondria targeting-associated protein 19 n=1 Tax=Linderina pennispora TaxID=61395 RepID=A0A1Y1W1J5_9FUNG|nr:uncharacterized protein DL89DRAFT_269214 [Linderina pennispora]ORX67381.1 hypothetical protein DL89DRAFT_269214 [Linderina pennispora]
MATLDTVYIGYFASHIPITLAVDLMPLLPRALVPGPLLALNTFLTQTLRDPFMVIDDTRTDLTWFRSFLACELVFQLPFFFYALKLLLAGSPRRHPWLAVYGAHVVTTMVPILATLAFNITDRTVSEKLMLAMMYGPYLAIPLLMVATSLPHCLAAKAKTD